MTIDDEIRDEKLQHDISRETAKTSARSSGKIDKYEYVTGNEMLPSNQSRFTVFSSIKSFLKSKKNTIEDADEKQTKALQTLSTGQLVIYFQEIF